MNHPKLAECQDLILVTGHAPFRKETQTVPEHPERDEAWALNPKFQLGEPPFYLEHMRRGSVLAARNPRAMLMFSGGQSRPEAGPWSEAMTYYAIAKAAHWWVPLDHPEPQEKIKLDRLRADIEARATLETYARDSYENLLYGLCRFQRLTNRWPGHVTIVSWRFKAARFELHRKALRFPSARFTFDCCNDPIDLEGALRGERAVLNEFLRHPHGTTRSVLQKRRKRACGERTHDYRECPGLKHFIDFIESLKEGDIIFPAEIQW